MNSFSTLFLLLNIVMLLLLPRRLAPVPLLVGACYMTLGQGFQIGPFHFSILRVLIVAAILRVAVRGEYLLGGMNGLDRLMLFWAVWALISSAFHQAPSQALVFRLGVVFNACGIYFSLRIFCQSLDEVTNVCLITAFILVPVAVEMVYEKLTLHNLFSVFGGVHENPLIRKGNIRAQGPFAHAILAGTVGAVSLPLMINLRPRHPKGAIIGSMACLAMVITSASSGPIMSTIAGLIALLMWPYRHHMRLVRWLMVFGYAGLNLVMNVPAYYLLARIDLAGGSTGWHRAALIDSAFTHLDEWWLGGTDYTRHWMPTGIAWNENHTDITNYYLHFGVLGGLPLMLLFIITLAKGFSLVGQALQQASDMPLEYQFTLWSLGATLFAHTATFISVSYFDQSFLFLYLSLSVIASAASAQMISKGHLFTEAIRD